MVELQRLIDAIRSFRFRYVNEDELQRGLTGALEQAGFVVRREVRLTARDRIDLLVGRIGIEVKIAGNAETVNRQITRYLASDELDGVILVTSRVRHFEPAPTAGKPVVVMQIAGAGL